MIMMEQQCEPEDLSSCLNHVQKLPPLWSKLPSIVLENIYLCLNQKDRIKMSLVCKSWSREYSAPSLWKNIKFVLNEIECTTGICPEVKFARKYAHMFQHVEIMCKGLVPTHLLEVKCKQLELFLQSLTIHSQLLTLSFINIRVYLRHLKTEYADGFKSILNLLSAQRKLKSLEFRNVWFGINEAANVFGAICKHNNSTLESLKLENFVEEFPEIFDVNIIDDPSTYDTLINLREIVVDYSKNFENIVMAWSRYTDSTHKQQIKSSLEKMKILCVGSKNVSYQTIPSAAWQCLRKKCPALKIDLSFDTGDRHALEVFVTKYMPVWSINFKALHYEYRLENEIGSMLQHLVLCDVNECLEKLNIIWMKNTSNLSRDLIYFLQACSRLRVLKLYLRHPVDALDSVFNFWLENGRKSVELVHITVTWVMTTFLGNKYIYLEDVYAPLLRVKGINLTLRIHYYENH